MVEAARTHTITVRVNNRSVMVTEGRGRAEATGAEIKAAAMEQGVNIQLDFALFHKRGNKLIPVGNDESIPIHPQQEFRAVAPDDNS